MQKWNYEKREYEKYEVPEDWKCYLYSSDMERKINCAACGREVIYAEGYTSFEIHNQMGFGYIVCDECYEKEKERKFFTNTDRKEKKMGENIAKAVMWVSVAAAVAAAVYWTKSAWPLWAFMIPLLAM